MFCPKCGSEIPDKAKYCPFCGEVIENSISLLKTTSITNNEIESDLTISLSGGDQSLVFVLNNRARFHVTIQNHSTKPIFNIDIRLYGPREFTMLIASKQMRVLGGRSSKNIYFTVLPEKSGDFALTVNLRSDSHNTYEFPIQVKVELPKPLETQIKPTKFQISTPVTTSP